MTDEQSNTPIAPSTSTAPATPTTPAQTSKTLRRVLFAAGALLVAGIVAFGAIAPPEDCPAPTAASLEQTTADSTAWFVRNQNPDGTWLYEYDTTNNVDRGGYNMVRHAGAVMGLYAAASAGLPDALESGDKGLAWAQQHLVDHDDWTTLAFNGQSSTGGAALLAAGLAERRQLTGDTSNDELMRRLGRFMVAQTLPDGAVIAQYDTDAMQPYGDSRSKYYTGEAYWALARLHRVFPDEDFGAASDRIGNYLATKRDEVEGYWPAIPDHWVAYGLAETVQFPERDPDKPLTDAELAYARRQAALFGGQVRWVSQQAGPWGRLVRGSHVVRGGGYGVLGEGLTGLWRVAEADARLAGLRAPLAARAECIAGLAEHVQNHEPADPKADGAWLLNGVTRMDDQQHATSALLRTVAIVESNDTSTTDDAPSWWLWAIVLIATLNPLFVALAMPVRNTARERASLAAVGGTIGAAIVVVVAALSGPVLDVLDVSAPAARIAVGVVGAAAGIVRMIRRVPSPQLANAGLSAAVVPVAIPYVATPALTLLGLSAGADRGVLFVAVTMIVGVAILVAKAAWLTAGGRSELLARWGVRLLGAIAIATCVLLVVDGALDV